MHHTISVPVKMVDTKNWVGLRGRGAYPETAVGEHADLVTLRPRAFHRVALEHIVCRCDRHLGRTPGKRILRLDHRRRRHHAKERTDHARRARAAQQRRHRRHQGRATEEGAHIIGWTVRDSRRGTARPSAADLPTVRPLHTNIYTRHAQWRAPRYGLSVSRYHTLENVR